MGMTKDFFIFLSQNKWLNEAAKRWGLKLGAQSVVAGTNIKEMIQSVKKLNAHGISATIDHLGEFVDQRAEALEAKEQILQVIEAIHEHEVHAHISLKPTQLGLDIDNDFCLENIREIVAKADAYNIFVNFDMEDYGHLQPSFDLVDHLSKEYDNIGTVIQAYFYRAEDDIKTYKDYRLRIVKGAYKEPEEIAYQDQKAIDQNFVHLIEYHLMHGAFTSIATHDHHIINHVKTFVEQKSIPKDSFEFQMLYGFRNDLQLELAQQGYHVCTYVPFGDDWYGYFMRRLAERPQNMKLITKQIFNKRTKIMIGGAIGAFLLGRLSKKNKSKKNS